MLFCFGKVLRVLQCLTWCLTSCALLPWENEVQHKMWAQVVISPMLFPTGANKPEDLLSARLCGNLFVSASTDLTLCFKCDHTRMQLM